ncbi:MAG: hypothetical protein H0U01_07240 [Acidimicrobiia bacterium]|nr:hypothetical protein [Acidimicrobiia bacterium]
MPNTVGSDRVGIDTSTVVVVVGGAVVGGAVVVVVGGAVVGGAVVGGVVGGAVVVVGGAVVGGVGGTCGARVGGVVGSVRRVLVVVVRSIVVEEESGAGSMVSLSSPSPVSTKRAMMIMINASVPAASAATGPRSRYHGTGSSGSMGSPVGPKPSSPPP